MLSDPRTIFGIHSFTAVNRSNAVPYGTMKVLKSSSLSFGGSLVPLKGGSAKYPWAVEEGPVSSQLSLKTSAYPDFLFQLFGGATPTENGADASGSVTTLTNKYGTSVVNATTGIASVGIISGSETDLKFGKYVVVVISATTVQLYASSDVDFGGGTAKNFNSDSLDLSSANFTIATSSAVTNITGFGIKLIGGSGTIAMTIGDTATFEVRPKNSANMVVTIGNVASIFPEFQAILYAKKKGTGELMEIDCPRVKGEGIPLGLDEDKWSEADIKCTVLFDPALDYVARIRNVLRSSPN